MSSESEPPPQGQGQQGPPSLFERAMAAPVSTFLFAMCIAVFVFAERTGSTRDTETLIRFGANYRGGVWNGEWWRLFTSMFLHIGVVHLVWNIWAGFSWTAPFERVLGSVRFLFIYLASGLAGSALSVIGHDAVSAGASGALFGVVGGIFVLMRERLGGWRALWNDPGQRRQIMMMGLWLAIGPFIGFDSFAHAGGMLAGAALTAGLIRGKYHRLGPALFGVVAVIVISLKPLPVLHDDWVDPAALQKALKAGDWNRVLALTENPAAQQRFQFARGAALIQLGRVSEGEALLPTVAPSADQVELLAGLHAQAGALDRALKTYDAALEDSPRNLTFTRAKYELLRDAGKLDEADALADQLIDDHPGTPLAYGLMGRRLVRDGAREQALEDFERAVEGNAAEWSEDLTLLLIDLGRRDEAKQTLERSVHRAWLQCYLSSVEGDFASNEQVCASLDDSAASRRVKAYRLAGVGKCDEATASLQDDHTTFARTLVTLCDVRARGLEALDPEVTTLEERLMRFSVTKNLDELAGDEDAAKHHWLWSLLSDEAKRALPR